MVEKETFNQLQWCNLSLTEILIPIDKLLFVTLSSTVLLTNVISL